MRDMTAHQDESNQRKSSPEGVVTLDSSTERIYCPRNPMFIRTSTRRLRWL